MTKEQTKRVYTAMHYDTNDKLKADLNVSLLVSNIASSDVLSPATDYTAYIFSNSSIIQRIEFTTLAIPPVGDAKWVDNTANTDKLNFTLSIPSDRIVSIQAGEILLFPFYMKFSYLRTGLRFLRPNGSAKQVFSCSTTTLPFGDCAASIAGYAVLDAEVFSGDNNHSFSILGIQSVAPATDVGTFTIRDGGSGTSNLTLSTD